MSPNTVLGLLKNDRMISVCYKGKPFNITVIQIYTRTTDAKEAERTKTFQNTKKNDALFIIGNRMKKSEVKR